MLGEIWLIFALDPKLNSAAETLPFQPGQKFLCFVVHFFEKVWFWCQTKIVPKKVYAGIWPVLEITSLNFGQAAAKILDVNVWSQKKYVLVQPTPGTSVRTGLSWQISFLTSNFDTWYFCSPLTKINVKYLNWKIQHISV